MAATNVYVTGPDGNQLQVGGFGKFDPLTRTYSDEDRPFYDFSSAPESESWKDFMVGEDPAYAGNRANELEGLGFEGALAGATYGGKSYGAANDIWDSSSAYADNMAGLGEGGARDLSSSGVDASAYGRGGATDLENLGNNSLVSGSNWAGDINNAGSRVASGLTSLESGPGTASLDQLNFARDRSLSAQKALGGTTRGLGTRQNTTMDEALIQSNAGRNAEILAAKEDAAFKARRSAALTDAGSLATSAATQAEQQRQRAIGTAGNAFSSAGNVALTGQQIQADADNMAATYGLEGYSNAANTSAAGGAAAAGGVVQGGAQTQQGAGAIVDAGGRAAGVRDIEQRAGMAREDYLTNRYAAKLGQSAEASAAAARQKAALYGAIGDGVSTFVSNIGGK